MRTVVIVKVVAVNEAGDILLLKRSLSASNRPGDWDFPGGHVDGDEDFPAAVCRELAEETGIKLVPAQVRLFFAHTMMVSEDLNAVRLMYWVKLPTEVSVSLSEEHASYQWTPAADVPTVFPHPVFGQSVAYGIEHQIFEGAETPFILATKAVVLRDTGDVLLIRRSPNDEKRPGEWDFPGGGVDDGEEYTPAVIREISEEAGIDLQPSEVHLFYAHSEMGAVTNTLRLVFWSHPSDPEVTLSYEHTEFKWVPAAQVSTEFKHHVYGPAVDYALEHRLFDEQQPA